MKRGLYLIALLGLLLALALIVRHGFANVGQAFVAVGWSVLTVTAFHFIPLFLSARAWQKVMRRVWQGDYAHFLQARLLREGVSNLLPVVHVGGDLAGARMLAFKGAPAASATTGVVIDMTLELVTQLAFTFLGLFLVMIQGGHQGELGRLSAGVAVAVMAIAGYVLAQRYGMFKIIERLLQYMAEQLNQPALGAFSNLDEEAQGFYRDRRTWLSAAPYHFTSWLAGVGEIWLALHFMGIELGWGSCMVIESLGQAVRSAGFIVPGALGVQEGGLIFIGGWYGLDPSHALALSLVKRVREFLLGLPMLIFWHHLESRRWLARRPEAAIG